MRVVLTYPLKEAGEHSFNLVETMNSTVIVAGREVTKVAREKQVILEFVCGTHTYVEESS
jgi:hypothetical protein